MFSLNIHFVIKLQVINQKMEGKTVIFSVLVMGLVISQIQVEAQKTCCPSQSTRKEFEDCISEGNLQILCSAESGCRDTYVGYCPSGFPYGSLTNSGKNWTHLVICFIKLHLLEDGSRFHFWCKVMLSMYIVSWGVYPLCVVP